MKTGRRMSQADTPDFRELKARTLLLAVESWFGSTPKKYDEAIKRIEPFLDTIGPNDKKKEEYLTLQLWLAKALKAGQPLATALGQCPLFPVEFIEIVAVGEEGGLVPEVMRSVQWAIMPGIQFRLLAISTETVFLIC